MGSLLRPGIVVLALAVLGVAGACGGDSEPPGGDGPSTDAPSGDDGPGAVDGAPGDTSPADARDLCTRDQECDDRNGCTVDTCPMGRCVYTVRPDGESCNDDVACTNPDTCAGGVCSGPPRDCAALDDFCNLGV